MNITSSIELKDITPKEKEHIITLFSNEDKELSNNRASYTITQEDTKITFSIVASDGVALRAVISSIGKTLAMYEKMKGLTDNE